MKTYKDTAVILFQLGGPDSLDAVEPFLYNLFCDPDIIDIPGAFLFRRKLARLISTRRSPKVIELYKEIGNQSPILEQTRQQADAVKNYLADKGIDIPVKIAMRYWHPFTDEAIDELNLTEIRRLILAPLYPHFSKATTGSSVNELKRVLKMKNKEQQLELRLIHSYPVHPLYIESLIDRINGTLEKFAPGIRDKVELLFSAHGTPMKLVRDGDPYSKQIRETYEAVVEKGNFSQHSTLCFQSKVGPQKWLEPSLIETVDKLGKEGIKYMLAIPIAFVSEHIETLSEIGIYARKQALALGVEQFEVMPALKDHPKYIECLGELILEKL